MKIILANNPKLDFISVAEAAGYLQVSKMTIYRMLHSGEIKHTRVGKAFRIHLVPFYRQFGYVEEADAVSAFPKGMAVTIPNGDTL